ncbi:MAG: ABC transporter substrate-binding protein [Alphaproteobacteria bacterium]|nr:ABC transporter substrate-binding protein [Alphaproteobacteria bacterium]
MRMLARLALLVLLGGPAAAGGYQEPPFLAEAVASGTLPPVDRRVPDEPLVWRPGAGKAVGVYGGDWRTMIHREKDVRLLAVYGYARLVGYDEDYGIHPDLLADVTVADERVFTLRLRRGHRWSDGAPFTVEDFRYWWEDVANDPDLSPTGPPQVLIVDGEAPTVTFPDAVTVVYAWTRPNPFFLPAMASTTPLFIFGPAHYLKQFHARFADPAILEDLVEEAGQEGWAALHNQIDNMYRSDNPNLPTLQPWVLTTAGPSKRYVAVRNPYYHRVDPDGRQLPYIDRLLLEVVDSKLIPAKSGAGGADLQGRGLNFNNYTFLKDAEAGHDYAVYLWRTAVGAQQALYPNLSVVDPVWRTLLRDARFRRALSLAIDRHEINQVIYYGLAVEGNNTVLPWSPLFEDDYRTRWATFDLAAANALLDEIGLVARDGRGVRLLPDGRPLEIVVETAGEDTEQSDVLELVHDSWLQIGAKLYTKPLQREVLRNRVFAGETVMSIWSGYENAVPTADMSPFEFAPTMQQSLQWPMWGQYFETGGESGEPVDLPEAQRLMDLNDRWRLTESMAEREAIWREMIAINVDQVYTIGLASGTLQPIVVSKRLNNVPSEGIFNWEPGAQFGVYRPDTFWFSPEGAESVSN